MLDYSIITDPECDALGDWAWVAAFWGGKECWLAFSSKQWPKASATIIRSEVIEDDNHFGPAIEYAYRVEGTDYRNDRIIFASGERRLRQISLDDAVEHGDQRRPFPVQRFRHLREADPANVPECREEQRQRDPRDRAFRLRQRCLGVNLAQGAFDLAAALENCLDLGCRDASTAPVGRPEVRLIE